MSDFDEEAERERLREQFEQDRKKREATEQMSELLLQGATMTDTHCETCGDPIFRYDGQEFCPTCQQSAGENAEDTTAADDGRPETQDGATDPSTEPAAEKATASDEPSVPTPESQAAEGTSQPETETRAPETSTGTQPEQRVDVPGVDPATESQPSREAGDLHDARDSLVATVSSFARQAETTDDPRRAKDALEATREAAEALAALESIR